MKKLLMLLVLIPTLLTGCATIVGDKTQTIAIIVILLGLLLKFKMRVQKLFNKE